MERVERYDEEYALINNEDGEIIFTGTFEECNMMRG